LLFAIDRFGDLVEALPIDKPRGVVLICESLRPMRFVLKNTPVQIVRHPNIEGPASYFGACKRNSDTHGACFDNRRANEADAVSKITLNL
jgi:hypothetical protein